MAGERGLGQEVGVGEARGTRAPGLALPGVADGAERFLLILVLAAAGIGIAVPEPGRAVSAADGIDAALAMAASQLIGGEQLRAGMQSVGVAPAEVATVALCVIAGGEAAVCAVLLV